LVLVLVLVLVVILVLKADGGWWTVTWFAA